MVKVELRFLSKKNEQSENATIGSCSCLHHNIGFGKLRV